MLLRSRLIQRMTCVVAILIVSGMVVAAPPQDEKRKLSAIDVPLTIDISLDEKALAVNALVTAKVKVTAQNSLQDLRIRTGSMGRLQLLQPANTNREFIAKDDSFEFELPVRISKTGESSIVVNAVAVIAGSDFEFTKQAKLNVLMRDDRAFVGAMAQKDLQRRALKYDVQQSRIAPDVAAARQKELNAVDMVPGILPAKFPMDPRWRNLTVEPMPVDRSAQIDDEEDEGGVAGGSSNITVEGTLQYTDENGNLHPVFGYQIEIWDEDFGFDDLIAEVVTGTDGTYSVTFGSGDPDGPDIYCELKPRNSLIRVETLGGGDYVNTTGVTDNVGSNVTINHSFTFAATGDGPVGSICSGATWIAVYTRDNLLGGPLGQIPFEFPGATNAAFYDDDVPLINMRPNDRFDWDVLHHEYGHYVMDVLNIENNPGGPHNIGDCISVTPNDSTKSRGVRLAWGEGWPTYFGTAGQIELGIGFTQAPRVGDIIYQDTVDGFDGFSYSLETNSNGMSGPTDSRGLGEDNEVAVQRILWDLYDPASDSRDTVSYSEVDLLAPIAGTGITTLSGAWALFRADGTIVPDNQALLDVGAITTDHAVGPQPQTPADGSIVNPGDTLTWLPFVGCDPSFVGNLFNLEMYNSSTFALAFQVGTVAPMHTMSAGDVIAVTTTTHNVRWAADGINTSSPQTGPYLGDNFMAIVNTPPVCNSGGNADDDTRYEAACEGPGTTIALNGSGSDADPIDQDILTYMWTTTCPLTSFDDDTDPTTNLVFDSILDCPTVCTVTLTVSDGIQEAVCTSEVELIDEFPPQADCAPTQAVYEVDENCEVTVEFNSTVTDNCCIKASDVTVAMTVSDNATLVFNDATDCTIMNTADNVVSVNCTGVVSDLKSCPAIVDFVVNANDCCNFPLDPPCETSAEVVDVIPPDPECPDSITLERGDKLCNDDVQDWLDSFTATDNCSSLPEVQVMSDFVALPITDGAPVSHTLTVADSVIIDDVYVDLRLAHTWVGDLVVDIEHLGTTVRVIDQPNCDTDNYSIVLGDTGLLPIQSTCADDLSSPPIYSPANALTAFNGLDSAGDWTITIVDAILGDDGMLQTWGVRLNGDLILTNDAPACGFPFDSTTTVTFSATDACNNTADCTADITILPPARVDAQVKGSLLVYPNIELRWRPAFGGGYDLVTDTYLSVLNDYNQDVSVHFLFVNGDDNIDAELVGNPPVEVERAHDGWTAFNWTTDVTANESTYLSMATGDPAGAPPFSGLDNVGGKPGRPDPEATDGSRILRGYALAWATDVQGRELTWDFLSGKATIVNFADLDAWEYMPFAYTTDCTDTGEEPLDCTLFDMNGTCCTAEVIPGNLDLDAFQYGVTFNTLLLDFFASGSTPFASNGLSAMIETDLSILPMVQDLRQDNAGPIHTKLDFDIWDENEEEYSGTERCIWCWDQFLLSNTSLISNNFLASVLETDKGKARIDGVQSDVCEASFCCARGDDACISDYAQNNPGFEAPICSQPAPLLGVGVKIIGFSGASTGRSSAGSLLPGQGRDITGRIQADLPTGPEQAGK